MDKHFALLSAGAGVLVCAVSLLFPSQFQKDATPHPSSIRVAVVKSPVERAGVTNDFDWRMVESTNYYEFIGRLRAVHCPEQTIRDIVFMDLLRSAASPSCSSLQDHTHQPDNSLHFRFERVVDMMDLLLGVDAGRSTMVVIQESQFREIDLPEPAVSRLRTMEISLRNELQELWQASANQPPTAELAARAEQLKHNFDQQLKAEMNPSEYADYRFRASPMPEVIRQEASEMSLTELEVTQLFAIEDALEREAGAATDPEDAYNSRAGALIDVLGSERAGEYLRVRSPSYQEAKAYGFKVGLEETAIQSLAALRDSYEAGQETDTGRRQQIRESAQQVLGPMFDHYLHNGGYWLAE